MLGWRHHRGEVKIAIPDPPGFAPVTPEMEPLYKLTKQLVPASNQEFLSFIPVSGVEAALQGQVPNLARRFSVQGYRQLIPEMVSAADFEKIKVALKDANKKTFDKVRANCPIWQTRSIRGSRKNSTSMRLFRSRRSSHHPFTSILRSCWLSLRSPSSKSTTLPARPSKSRRPARPLSHWCGESSCTSTAMRTSRTWSGPGRLRGSGPRPSWRPIPASRSPRCPVDADRTHRMEKAGLSGLFGAVVAFIVVLVKNRSRKSRSPAK